MNDGKAGWAERWLEVCLVGLAGLSLVLLVGQALAPQPWQFGWFTVDRLSAVMTVLVAGIGAVCYRFALRYLDGEPGQRRFLRWLALTVFAAYLLMLATNLWALFVAWALTSGGLHQLLTFYRQRPEAQRPARKKFLISRLGDLALLAAIVLIWRSYGTFDLLRLHEVVRTNTAGPATTAIALFIVIAALTKSAQFPFHTWLPETMEAPTPVSALMHAGIINAGGVLLLRFAPLLVGVPVALLLLSAIGTLTLVIGLLAMWLQADVKRTLAWSTVSQMGFMMVQCGLAVFPAAALHIVGHGCYKAWSFLRSGQLPPVSQRQSTLTPAQTLAVGALGVVVAVPALALAAWLTGFEPLHSPGEFALSSLLALSIGQLWVGVFSSGGAALTRVGLALFATFAVSLLAFGLYHGAALFLAPALGTLAVANSPLAWVAALLPVVTLIALTVVYAYLPVFSRSAAGRRFLIHALHGFYVGIFANRLVDLLWPPSPTAAKTAPDVQPAFATGGTSNG